MNEHQQAAFALAETLQQTGQKIVFAESCTCGLLASTLGRVPGISLYLCGSAVTYQNETKARWLGVERDVLVDPGPVSEVVARQMVDGVLRETPQADLAASVTGHLGPNAEKELDGVVYIGIGLRNEPVSVERIVLPNEYPHCSEDMPLRICRIEDLVGMIFNMIRERLAQ